MGAVGEITPGVSPHLLTTRSEYHRAGTRDQPGILLIGETERGDRPIPVRICQQREGQRKVLHNSRVLRYGVGAEGEDATAGLKELTVSAGEDGQLAVAIASEVAAVKRDDCSRVIVIRERPWTAGAVKNREVKCHGLVSSFDRCTHC